MPGRVVEERRGRHGELHRNHERRRAGGRAGRPRSRPARLQQDRTSSRTLDGTSTPPPPHCPARRPAGLAVRPDRTVVQGAAPQRHRGSRAPTAATPPPPERPRPEPADGRRTPGFDFNGGEVWSVHTAGATTTALRRARAEGDCLRGGGELLAPGEVSLARRDLRGPAGCSAWSTRGSTDEPPPARAPEAHATEPEQRPVRRPTRGRRPLRPLPGPALRAGRRRRLGRDRRFVLDDGWFSGRRDATAGLGDWTVDTAVWPRGWPARRPRARRAWSSALGRAEMVNVDSETPARHPERVLARHDLPPEWRTQQVLDLQDQGAYDDARQPRVPARRGTPSTTSSGTTTATSPTPSTTACRRPRPDSRRLRAARRAASSAPGSRSSRAPPAGRVDAEVLTRTDRSAERHDRPARAPAPPTLDVAARAAGAHRLPRRRPGGAHHRADALRLATAPRPRCSHGSAPVGPHPPRRGHPRRAAHVDRPPQAGATPARAAHWSTPPPDPAVLVTGLVAAARSEASLRRHAVAATATQPPPRSSSRGSTPTGATASSRRCPSVRSAPT